MTDHQPPPAVEAIGRLEELARAAYRDYALADIAVGGGARATVSVPAYIQAASPQAILSLIESLRHSVEREAGLRLALAPFAEVAGLYDDNLRPGLVLSDVALIRSQLTLGDLREARAALDRRAGT